MWSGSNPINRAQVASAATGSSAKTILPNRRGVPFRGPFPSIATMPSAITKWTPYELSGCLYPVYIRGQAYLAAGQGAAAAGEFRKILDHRGLVVNCPTAALANLGLARAYALQKDTTNARAAYQDFFALWKDADPTSPS